jgi:L-lysine exporter family protein LysE/ArgO
MVDLRTMWNGAIFGLGAAAPIGPINVEMARRALGRSWAAGACLGLGAVSIDVLYACIATAGVHVAGNRPWIYWPIAVAGTLLLIYLGIASLREAARAYRGGWAIESAPVPARPLWKVYATGVMMTAANPMTLAFWFGGLSSSAENMGVGPGQLPMLAVGVFLGTVSWVLAYSTLMAVLGRFRQPWWMAAADLIGGIVLLGFAGVSISRCVERISSSS